MQARSSVARPSGSAMELHPAKTMKHLRAPLKCCLGSLGNIISLGNLSLLASEKWHNAINSIVSDSICHVAA